MKYVLYEALRKVGVNDQDARAFALEASKTNPYFSEVDKNLSSLKEGMD